MPRAAFYTLGCKVNQYETEALMDQFREQGYDIVNFTERADVYVINSCTVTTSAASKSRKYARRAKRQNPAGCVVLVGCYAQVSPEELEDIAEIDYILGTKGKKHLVHLLESAGEEDRRLERIVSYQDIEEFEDLTVSEVKETTRAYVKIEEGCNQFCSYCIIPYARGPVRSRPRASILKEIKNHLSSGVREIVLTGIHLGAYGFDWNEPDALVNLLKDIFSLDNEFRLRLSSLEVTEASDRLLDLMKHESRFCPHLHLPLQSGSDKILKAMSRPYSSQDFREQANKIRKNIPDIAITTDVICGFPGEKEEDFKETYYFIEEIAFSRLHVFTFSPREGTLAAEMENRVPGNVKKEYSSRLHELNENLMLNYQKKFLGKVRSVVVEENTDYETGMITGFTDNYIRVLLSDVEKYKGKL
ncbi:MAG: tRNA (N(6)-L-threonylcarbamoyladenosine(37)-C(2))-methylthiotransferase MtaB, partial [Halanaerobiales bacterium]